MVKMKFPEPIVDSLNYLAVENTDEFVIKSVTNAIKSKLNYLLYGSRVKTAEESTHSLVRKGKTLYYKGGMKETAVAEFRNLVKMAPGLGIVLPKELNESKYVQNKCEELASLIARISAEESDADSEQDAE